MSKIAGIVLSNPVLPYETVKLFTLSRLPCHAAKKKNNRTTKDVIRDSILDLNGKMYGLQLR